MGIIKKVKDVIQGKSDLDHNRSGKWVTVRKHFIEKNPTCAVCGGTDKLEVHHIKPFNEHPELELDENNLITLCESKSLGVVCHLWFGHLGNYRRVNPNVVEDTIHWNQKRKDSLI